MDLHKYWKDILVPIVIFLCLWQSIAMVVVVLKGLPFPTPVGVIGTLCSLLAGARLSDHSIFTHVRDSLWRWSIGFGIAGTLGILYGLLAGWLRGLERATYPILLLFQVIPGLAWIPVAILCFGIGETSTVFMITMTVFPPVALNVLSGVKHLDPHLVRAGRMLGAKGGSLLLRVFLPGALPGILTGLRLGLGNGWRVLVAAEMIVGSGTGLGYSIIQARWTLDYNAAFACLGLVCIIGLLIEHILFLPLERRTTARWRLDVHAR
jgi:ABC-type nitrate/sulfonate/bicarbonate transport system permease component